MKVAGSALALCVMTVAVVFCATALGLFLASFGGTEKQVGSVGSITILVMGLLGGAMVPRLVMPETMQKLGLVVPHGWALDGYYDILIRQGTTLGDVAVPILAVFGFGVAFAAIGSLRFKFER
jgi:ABC-2 type transport system permease protein